MSASTPQSIAEVVRNVIGRDREARGLPPITDDEAESARLLEIARASRRR